ncbi:DNA-binding protein [Halobacteriales archaeon SW_5_70_135]|nr:MAG: DNA-binding protein [Halobacteriales archaeon SW_5_70_135]
MSDNPDEDELDRLREERMEQLQDRDGEQAREQAKARQQQADAQRKAVLRQYLTDGARKRLNSVKMSKPDFGDRVEQQVVALAQSGRIKDRIDEDQMRELLRELQPDDDGFNIRRR